jgi:hypothetical protein
MTIVGPTLTQETLYTPPPPCSPPPPPLGESKLMRNLRAESCKRKESLHPKSVSAHAIGLLSPFVGQFLTSQDRLGRRWTKAGLQDPP